MHLLTPPPESDKKNTSLSLPLLCFDIQFNESYRSDVSWTTQFSQDLADKLSENDIEEGEIENTGEDRPRGEAMRDALRDRGPGLLDAPISVSNYLELVDFVSEWIIHYYFRVNF